MSDQPHLLSLAAINGVDFMPVAFHAEESISAPFSLTIEAVTSAPVSDPNSLLYQAAVLTVEYGVYSRVFHGFIRAVTVQGTPVRNQWRYTLSVAPKLWFMSQTIDCRIFQQKAVADILTTICGENNQTLQLNIYGTKTQLDYVTQYNETDLDFISRLMEQAGYFYFFQHSGSDHTLVVTDQNQGFPASPKPTVNVVYAGDNVDVLSSWRQTSATAWGSVTLMDYDPSQASPLTANQPTTFSVAGTSGRDITRWPALSFVTGTISGRAKIEIGAAEAQAALTDATGFNCSLMPGGRFTLAKDPVTQATSVDYVVRGIIHSGQDETWIGGTAKPSYQNSLSCFPMSVPWLQPLTVPRPVMAGIYAAVVIGGDGDEILTDSLARIKCRLLWDHRQETVANQAIWARVITPMAGNGWGMQHMPRVGTEVAVAFMDGDPDRPVVVGGFYNASNSPIFPVPDQMNKSGFRSRSTKQGGTGNFSEFSFDDTKGSELVYFHAEYNHQHEVENNETITVSGAQNETIAKGRTTTINDQGDSLTVKGGNHTIEVSQGNHAMTVDQGKHSTTVSTGDMAVTVSTGKHSTTVSTGDQENTVSTGNQKNTVSMGNVTHTVSMGNHSTELSLGNLSIKCDAGAVTIEALQSITLKVMGNQITIGPSGVSIQGIQLQLQGQAQLSAQAPMVQINGDGMVQLQGGITMIN